MFITLLYAVLTWLEGVQAGALLESLFQRETTLNSSGGFLGGSANESPINIGAHVFTADGTVRFALKIDTKAFPKFLTSRNAFSDVPNRRATASRKLLLLRRQHVVDKCKKYVHAAILPAGNLQSNTYRLFTAG